MVHLKSHIYSTRNGVEANRFRKLRGGGVGGGGGRKEMSFATSIALCKFLL